VIGLGRLGAPTAAVLAAAGHAVLGVDSDSDAVRRFNDRDYDDREPGLRELLGRFPAWATLDLQEAATTDITYLVVPTPSSVASAGGLDPAHVIRAVRALGAVIRSKADRYPESRHTVAVVSTVMPGTIGGPVRKALEQATGMAVGSDGLGLGYCPEFVALGNVIRGLQAADLVLVGAEDQRTGDELATVAASVLVTTSGRILRTSWINAEIAKLSLNVFLTLKVSYANALGEYCEQVPGADVQEVLKVLGRDPRIGDRCLQAATAVGGPCLGRDVQALRAAVQARGLEAPLLGATQTVQSLQANRLVRCLSRHGVRPEHGPVALVGLAYRQGTGVLDDTPAQGLAHALGAAGYEVWGHEPGPLTGNLERCFPSVRIVDLETVIGSAAVAVLTLPDRRVAQVIGLALRDGARLKVVDYWGVLGPHRHPAIIRPGVGPAGTDV
jgi:UDPglucose 6-dehydrogenase